MPTAKTLAWIVLFSAVHLILFHPTLHADVIVLKDGKQVAGDELKEEEDAYKVRTKYGVLTIPKDTVAEVIRVAPLLEEARAYRMGGSASLKRAEDPTTDAASRKLEVDSAVESLKQALKLFTKARSAAFGIEADGIDRVIAGIDKELARCRALSGPETLEPVAPPKGPDMPAVAPPVAKPTPIVKPVARPPKPPPRVPVPPEADRQRAEKEIRDLFKAEYARRAAEDRQSLAARLLRESKGTREDAAARYVLLAEAVDLAAKAGDPTTALAAVEQMDKGFEVDALALKQEALETAARTVRTTEASAALADGSLAVAAEAADRDDYDAAVSLASKAESAARRARDTGLASRAREIRKDYDSLRSRFRKVKGDAETLKDKPDDPAANLAVGRFRCLEKGDWARGLPLLAKGSDAALKALAEKDLKKPTRIADRIALGDAWWEAAEKLGKSEKTACRERAVHWYRTVSRKATGLVKTRIRARIDEHAKATAPPMRAGPVPGAISLFNGRDLSAWVNAKSGERATWPVVGGILETGTGNIQTRARFQNFRFHVEFCLEPGGDSGVYLQGRYEVNIRPNPPGGSISPSYVCGAIVGLKVPDRDAYKPPGVWQSYDIVFRAARFAGQKKIADARVTVVFNGVKIHDDVALKTATGLGNRESPEPGPVLLQSHTGKVRFRNIWIAPMR
jgi:hypothetical protein